MGRPRDDRDAARDLARELADLAGQLASLKGEAYAWLSDERYDTLRHRLEYAHAAVEAAAEDVRKGCTAALNVLSLPDRRKGQGFVRGHGASGPWGMLAVKRPESPRTPARSITGFRSLAS